MVYCNKCGSENSEGSVFCSRCGAEIVKAPQPGIDNGGKTSVQSSGVAASRGGRDKGTSMQIVALAVVLAVAIAAVAYAGLSILPQDEGSVYATWHYTALDETDEAYLTGTLTITIEDGFMVDYDKHVDKILKDDSDDPSIDLSPWQDGVIDPPYSLIPGPTIFPYEDSAQYHILHTYPFMVAYKDTGYSAFYTNGDTTVLAYKFENDDRYVYVSEAGKIISIVEKTGNNPMYFVLDGWSSS